MPWKDDGSGPNACTNAPGCLVATKLYERYGDEAYLQTAKDLYDYQVNEMKTKLGNDGRVEEPPLSYTQGTFGEAARRLAHLTGQRSYMTMASKVLYYAITSGRCTHSGLLRNEGSSMDQSIFKAVLIPYVVNYVLDDEGTTSYRKRMITFLQKNANTLWDNLKLDKYPKTFCNYYWGEPIDDAKVPSMGAMVSGASLIENVARMALALTATDDEDGVNTTQMKKIAAIYDLTGRCVAQPSSVIPRPSTHRGVYLIQQPDGTIKKILMR